jgi:hypothetical protein
VGEGADPISFLYLVVLETKGRSLEQIDAAYYSGKSTGNL